MAYVERTLKLGAATLVGQFRDDGDGAARFEGPFVVKRGDKLTDDDGVVWVVAGVKQADVAKKQDAYAWCNLRNAASPVAGKGAPEVEEESPAPVVEADVVALDGESDGGAEADPGDAAEAAPAPVRKRGKKVASEEGAPE